MNTLQTIYSRRSIRSYNGKSITKDQLDEILKSAYAAPVGRAMYDTLCLTVITNKDVLDKWESLVQTASNNPDAHPFYGAPTLILVSSVLSGQTMSNVNFSNAAILVENMALAATEMGIGSCHIWGAVRTLNENPDFIKELGIPQDMTPCCAIILGEFDGEFELRDVKDNRILTNYIE